MALKQQILEVETLIRARYPIIYITTWEEARVLAELVQMASRRDKRIFEWTVTTGLVPAGTPMQSEKARESQSRDPLVALDTVIDDVEPAIYIFKDIHQFLTKANIAIVRRLRDIAQNLKHSYKTVILISPMAEIPMELEKDITVVDFDLPGIEEFNALLDKITEDVKDSGKIQIDLDAEGRERFVRAALGLTLSEAENVIAKALVANRRLDADQVKYIFEEKKQIIRKNGLLEYFEPDPAGLKAIGGMDALKTWLAKRRVALTEHARKFGLPPPRGILLLGVQGCGKSLTAKAIGNLWKLPLLRFDVGRVFDSLVGSSEQNIRRAIKVAESVAPCVLWIDEIDKAFARQGGDAASTDGGASSRVFGTFITWLAEKTSPVFVVSTANDISALPPELMRKGRYDEIFFVDLPSENERREIVAIHLARRRRDPAKFDLDAVARATEGYSGAEIEEVIISALFDSYFEKHDLTDEALVQAARDSVPLSRTMVEEITKLRKWADGRARNATGPQAIKTVGRTERLEL
jgi:SpoVK/Ycf46/Vps4 family AAA+-type ATPase